MAIREENECAYCVGRIGRDSRFVGRDWKVYCSDECAEHGSRLSEAEAVRWLLSQLPPEEVQSHIFSRRG